jgi:hypothetical protein
MADWIQGGQGALGGAMTGAALGSVVVPGVGTAIGAGAGGLLGGLAGLFGSGDKQAPYRKMYEDYYKGIQGREAPQAGYSDFRGNQQDLIRMLEAQARGEGPSLAAQQAKATSDLNAQRAQAVAASGRGPSAALSQFQAQQTAGQLGAGATQQAMQGRIQEQLNAQQLLGLNIHGARGADEAMNKANMESILRMYGIQDEASLRAIMGASGTLPQPGPGMGSQLLAGGAGSLGFLAGQLGNQGNPQNQGG